MTALMMVRLLSPHSAEKSRNTAEERHARCREYRGSAGRALDVVREHRELAAELVEVARQVQVRHVLAAAASVAVNAKTAEKQPFLGWLNGGTTASPAHWTCTHL